MNDPVRDSTVLNPGMGYQFEDAIGRAEADWMSNDDDRRVMRRAIAEDVWPLVSGWLMAGASEDVAKLWAENKSLQEELRAEVGWWRAEFPDAEYPGLDHG